MNRFFFIILFFLLSFDPVKAQFSRIDERNTDRLAVRFSIMQKLIRPLYRKPSKEELETVAPNSDLSNKYAGFLRQENTGLTKLIEDQGCAENTKVVVASNDCLKYTMPGAGSSFSFRVQTYRISRLADITFTDKSFQAGGVFIHGIFVNIGDIPLENVTLQTAGLKYLTDFAPETDYEKSKEIDRQLIKGVKSDGFLYRRGLYIVEDTTFVLRSVAYDGKYMRSASGVTYNELDFDKRKDVIVAFRIVRKDADGNVTILWKVLQQKDAPELKPVPVK
ncbi:hypothetical protein BH20ACI4_BH20ACI4_22410 [soil metagenome]